MESIGEARDSQDALGWVGVELRASTGSAHDLRGLLVKRIFDLTVSIVLVLLLAPVAASAKFSALLQGQSSNSPVWVSGNLAGWQELDYIPVRVYFQGGPASSQAIRVDSHRNRNAT